MDPNQTSQKQQAFQTTPSTEPIILQQNPDKRKRIIIVVLILTFLLLNIVIFFYFLFFQSKENNETLAPSVAPIVTVKPTLIPFPENDRSSNTLVIRYKKDSYPDLLEGTARYDEIQKTFANLGVIHQERIEDYLPELPDLSYILTFKEGVDIESAAEEIYSLPEIDHVEPEVYFEFN